MENPSCKRRTNTSKCGGHDKSDNPIETHQTIEQLHSEGESRWVALYSNQNVSYVERNRNRFYFFLPILCLCVLRVERIKLWQRQGFGDFGVRGSVLDWGRLRVFLHSCNEYAGSSTLEGRKNGITKRVYNWGYRRVSYHSELNQTPVTSCSAATSSIGYSLLSNISSIARLSLSRQG